jgi:hypothetical protein
VASPTSEPSSRRSRMRRFPAAAIAPGLPAPRRGPGGRACRRGRGWGGSRGAAHRGQWQRVLPPRAPVPPASARRRAGTRAAGSRGLHAQRRAARAAGRAGAGRCAGGGGRCAARRLLGEAPDALRCRPMPPCLGRARCHDVPAFSRHAPASPFPGRVPTASSIPSRPPRGKRRRAGLREGPRPGVWGCWRWPRLSQASSSSPPCWTRRSSSPTRWAAPAAAAHGWRPFPPHLPPAPPPL